MSETPPPYPQQQPPQQPYPQQPYPQQPSPQQPPGFPGARGAAGGPAPGSPAGNADIRPKARWYWIGGGLIGIAVVIAIALGAFGVIGIANTVADFARVPEGSDTVRLDSAGDYVIYVEDGASSVQITVTGPDGQLLSPESYSSALTYDFDGRSGQAVGTFEAPETGDYLVTTDRDIAIGPSIAGDLVRTIVIPLVIGALGFLIGLVVIIVTAVKRSRSKKQLTYAG